MSIEFDGSINFEGGQSEGSASFEDGDDRFLNTLRSLVLQCFLALQYQPELLSDVELPTQKKGFSKPNEQEPSYRVPRWLGKDFKSKRSSESSTGTHSSPRTHWRRGHWRRVAVGQGRTERKVIWIQPVLVNHSDV
jgi:hypothetical protein